MKKVITIVIIVLIAIGFGYFLFKISPDTQTGNTSVAGYNGSVTQNQNIPAIAEPPAFDPAVDHYLGNKTAKNVFIEYGDMQCPYCAQYNPMIVQVPSKFPDTVFVFRYFPLLQHQNTVEASLAAESAGAQGKYWEMHDLLYEKQTEWENQAEPMDTFVKYAQQVGVANIDQFKSDITSKKFLTPMQKGEDESYALKLSGTPSYFLNGHPLQLATDMNGLLQGAQQYLNK